MTKNYDQSVKINVNPNWPYVPDQSYIILIIGGSGSWKTNVLLNLVKNQQPDFDKIYLNVKIHSNQSMNFFINGREKAGIEKLKNEKHSLIIHKQLIIFMKIQKIIIQQEWGEC